MPAATFLSLPEELVLLPLTDSAKIWCEEHLPEDALMFGSAYVVERRCIGPIIDGIINDGMVVQ